jgi:hypothetical protein
MQWIRPDLIVTTILAVLTTPALTGCADGASATCERSEECPSGQMCRLTNCVSTVRDTGTGDIGSDIRTTTHPSKDDDPDQPARCQEGRSPRVGELVINEVLANVPAGPGGDANGDGDRDAFGDEFIELVNRSGDILDLYDVAVLVDGEEIYAFAGRCLPPGHGMMLFGGVPMADSRDDVQVVGIAGIGLSNSGGELVIANPSDDRISDYIWEEAPPESHTLTPQIHGTNYERHSDISPDGSLFSPGSCSDGTELTSGC